MNLGWKTNKETKGHFQAKPKKKLVNVKSHIESNGITQHKFLKKNDFPEYQTDKWYKYKKQVEDQFDSKFNSIPYDNLEKIEPNWSDYIQFVEPTQDEIKDYFGERKLTWDEFEKKHNHKEINEAKSYLTDEQREVIWGTLFEASDNYIAEKIKKNSEQISRLGITVIDLGNSPASENYNTGVFLGMRSAGHDFYEAYWVPLWNLFGWLKK